MTPERAMRLALRSARRAEGRSHPNPPVGAVVFRGDRILARGHTHPVGGPHAEVVALARARRRHGARALRGASLAVTLEPCAHQGRTAPCVEAILAAGVSRVFVGHRDPHAPVEGRGLRRLRAAGVEVQLSVLEEACRYQHRGFLSWVTRGRPFVALKLAATLDGRIATSGGESRWITGPRARALAHGLRDRSDAVMVGSRTARADDPALTVRRGARVLRAPVRVLVDSKLVVPPTAQLYADAHASRTLVLAAPGTGSRRRLAREARGARVLAVPTRGGRIDLARGLRRLAREGITSLLVEGGGGLAAALLRRGLVDELHWLAAPALLGADARPAVAALDAARLAQRIPLRILQVKRLGPDVYVHALVARPPRSR